MRWFRLYTETLNDPKVQSLPAEMFKVWINILCVASEFNGKCQTKELGFHLRCSAEQSELYINHLVEAKLLVKDSDHLVPHNWEARQYQSDAVTQRVRAYRLNKKKVNVMPEETSHETFHVTTPCNVDEKPEERSVKKTAVKNEKKNQFILPLPDWLPLDDWNDYLEDRKRRNRKATIRAQQLTILRLDDLRKGGDDVGQVLRNSIINGWTGVFKIKDRNNESGTSDKYERTIAAAKRGHDKSSNPDF